MPAAARAPEVAAALKLPFAEQIAFFRGKLGRLVPTAKWTDLWQQEHDVALMVAGAAKADLLADLAEAVDKAISNGETIQQFRRRFLEIIEKRGWAGFTGDDRTTDRPQGGRGLAWRTRVIYETNLLTSYAAGRRAQLEDGGYTHWMYKHSDFVRRPRPHHVALNGIVRPKDDPFWQTHYPPNGWGCFPGDTEVRCNALLGFRFRYSGKIVEIETVSGNRLAVTPNHPILTRRGWVSADELRAGDQVIAAARDVDAALHGVVDDPQPPARAQDLFDALAAQGFRVAPMTPHDFDGDAAGGQEEVEIAGSHGALMDVLDTAPSKTFSEVGLDGRLRLPTEAADNTDSAPLQALVADDAVLAQNPAHGWLGQPETARDGALAAEPGAVHGDDLALGLGITGIRRLPRATHDAIAPVAGSALPHPAGAHAVRAVADRHAAQPQDALQCGTGDSELFGELLEANAGLVTTDEIVLIGKRDWSGHVYDFSTSTGKILAGGIVVSNCRCRVLGVRSPEQASRLGGDWDKPLPSWVGQRDPKTGQPVGVDKGFGYMPGGSVVERVRALTPKLDRLPAAPSVALIQDWLKTEAFAAWYAAPSGSWPLARLPDADAQAIGAADGVRVAHLSAETALKQKREHPELSASEYAIAQDVIDLATHRVQDGASLIYVRALSAGKSGGHVLVVKATRTGKALWVTSVRRLSRQQAEREAEIARLLKKGK